MEKKLITVNGGVISIDDITLNIGPGCLLQDTEITLIKDDHNLAFKSLVDLRLVDTIPRVIELLPDGIKFSKPAILTFQFETIPSDSDLFILHGSYSTKYQRTVWEVVTNDIEERTAKGVVNMKIHGFCFYSYIMAKRGKLARILSHLNHSFTLDFPEFECAPYSFKVDQPELDSVGFVIDHFKGTAVQSPACCILKISEVRRSAGNKTLWELDVCEEEKIKPKKAEGTLYEA